MSISPIPLATTIKMSAKKRAASFTDEERQLLQDILIPFKNILENTRTDATSVKRKKIAWTQIQENYNSHDHVLQRTSEQLKKAWDKIKMRHKKAAWEMCHNGAAPESESSMSDKAGDSLPVPADVLAPQVNLAIYGGFDSDATPPASPYAPPQAQAGSVSASLLRTDSFLRDDVSENEDDPLAPAADPVTRPNPAFPSRPLTRQTALSEEHALRTQQLRAAYANQQEIHAIRLREARLAADTEQRKGDEATLRLRLVEEELVFQREKQQLVLQKLRQETVEVKVEPEYVDCN